MADIIVFSHANFNMDMYHKELNCDDDGRLYLPSLREIFFLDRDGNETTIRLDDNITSLIMGDDAEATLWTGPGYTHHYFSAANSDALPVVPYNNNISSLKLWKSAHTMDVSNGLGKMNARALEIREARRAQPKI